MLEAWRRKRQKKRRGKSGKAKRGEERSEGYENNKERRAKEKAKGFLWGSWDSPLTFLLSAGWCCNKLVVVKCLDTYWHPLQMAQHGFGPVIWTELL